MMTEEQLEHHEDLEPEDLIEEAPDQEPVEDSEMEVEPAVEPEALAQGEGADSLEQAEITEASPDEQDQEEVVEQQEEVAEDPHEEQLEEEQPEEELPEEELPEEDQPEEELPEEEQPEEEILEEEQPEEEILEEEQPQEEIPVAELEEDLQEDEVIPVEEESADLDEEDLEVEEEDQQPDEELEDDGRRWYVVHCYSGYENKVRHNLEQRIETMGMKSKIFDVVVPTEEEIEVKEGKRRTVERRVFPGYILVQMIMDEDSWYVVRNTPGVTGFVGMGNEPTPLRPEEVASIVKRMEADAPRIKVTYKTGQKVRIIDGPFNDFIGTVDDIDMERAKVRVMVSFFGRETPVELDFLQVEKA
jgi:transcriptional antiterminator NusG